MSVIQYAVGGDSIDDAFYLDPQDLGRLCDWELEMLAQDAGDDYFDNHDGWESSWPVDIEIFADGISVGIFSVEMEATPTFTARKKKDTA